MIFYSIEISHKEAAELQELLKQEKIVDSMYNILTL